MQEKSLGIKFSTWFSNYCAQIILCLPNTNSIFSQASLGLSIDLRFHLQVMDDPDEAWENLEFVFGKHNIIRAHEIEN